MFRQLIFRQKSVFLLFFFVLIFQGDSAKSRCTTGSPRPGPLTTASCGPTGASWGSSTTSTTTLCTITSRTSLSSCRIVPRLPMEPLLNWKTTPLTAPPIASLLCRGRGTGWRGRNCSCRTWSSETSSRAAARYPACEQRWVWIGSQGFSSGQTLATNPGTGLRRLRPCLLPPSPPRLRLQDASSCTRLNHGALPRRFAAGAWTSMISTALSSNARPGGNTLGQPPLQVEINWLIYLAFNSLPCFIYWKTSTQS